MFKDLLNLNKALSEKLPPSFYVGIVVVDKKRNKIMLGKRPEDGIWTGPGGSANPGESPRAAALREIFEESNLTLRPNSLKDLPSLVAQNGIPIHCFMIDVDSSDKSIHSKNDPDKEIRKWQWLSLNEALPEIGDKNRLETINNAKLRLNGLIKSKDEKDEENQPEDEHRFFVSIVVVDTPRKKILLGLRNKDGNWTNPGGGAFDDESPKEACIRELFEETNIKAKAREFKEIPSIVWKKGQPCHCYILEVDSKAMTNIHHKNDPSDEIKKWEWKGLDEPLPSNMDVFRLMVINNAKLKIFGLKKAAHDDPDALLIENVSEQTLAEMNNKESDWVQIIRSTVQGLDYTDIPRELILPHKNKLYLSKVDDGFYSGFVKKEDSQAGNNGEVLLQLSKMTPEVIVQILKTKGYISNENAEKVENPQAEEVSEGESSQNSNDYKNLYDALKEFKGDLHIHLEKALPKQLDAFEEGRYLESVKRLKSAIIKLS